MRFNHKFIVLGCGMMGAAAAKYLAQADEGVAVIGPAEPADCAGHAGVFASHYDSARITRTVDPDPVWALLARRSIERYRSIEAESGIAFYSPCGALLVGPARGGKSAYIADVATASRRAGVEPTLFDGGALAARFPFFAFPSGVEGAFEAADAGYIDPRALVEAQTLLAERAGALVIRATAHAVAIESKGVAVTTDTGAVHRAEQVLVAAGGFSIAPDLLPRPLDLKVYGRTVALFEIEPDALPGFAGMPALIHRAPAKTDHIYLLPPVAYPDGRVYLKIGGDPDDLLLAEEGDVRAWFRGGGRESVRRHLARIARGLVPLLAEREPEMAACVTTFTPSGYPAIGQAVPGRIAVATGGCGAAAKSSDEIGRLAAELVRHGAIGDEGLARRLAPQFR